jgi:hypothetical protein
MMKYSELKKRIKLLRERGYWKMTGFPYYRKRFSYNNLHLDHIVSRTDVLFLKVDFNEFLDYMENEAVKKLEYAYKIYTQDE